jgi:hypothetical protein
VQSALFPAAVAAVVAVLYTRRFLARRRFERTNVSGGRKALVLNLDRSRW